MFSACRCDFFYRNLPLMQLVRRNSTTKVFETEFQLIANVENSRNLEKPTKMESQQMLMKDEALSQANPLRVLINYGEILRTRRQL